MAVWDPTDTGLQPRGKQVLNPNGIWYTAVSGIWQTVWLEPVPAAHIREIAMTPDLDGKRLRLTVSTPARRRLHRHRATARQSRSDASPAKTNAEVKLPLEPDRTLVARFARALRSRIALKSGDSVKSYFGMRKVEVRKDSRRRQSHLPQQQAAVSRSARSTRAGGPTDSTPRPPTRPSAPTSTRSRSSASTWRASTSRWSPRAGITGATSWASWSGRTCPAP